MKVHYRKHVNSPEAAPLGSVHSIVIETPSGKLRVESGDYGHGIVITALEGKLCLIPVDLIMAEVTTLENGYDIVYESEIDGG